MQTLTPTAVRLNNLSGSAADLDDSPDSPDASWCTRLGWSAWFASPSVGTVRTVGQSPSLSNSGDFDAATTRYIRAGASGSNNGTDWTNAYTSIPASLTRGYTYFVADGSYGSYTFDDAASGTSVITLKKATASSHGTSTGWDAAYGDGEATFSTLTMATGYYHLNGQTRTETTRMEAPAGYGFRVTSEIRATSLDGHNASHSTFEYMDVGSTWNTPSDGACLYLVYNQNNITFNRCCFHGRGLDGGALAMMHGSSYITWDHCDFYQGWGKATIASPNVGCNYHTIRYCRFWNASQKDPDDPTAGITTELGTYSYSGETTGNLVYGCIFYGTSSGGRNAVIQYGESSPGPSAVSNKVFNNTFVGFPEDPVVAHIYLYSGSGNEAKNNLFYDITGTAEITANSASNNVTEGTDPFVDYANLDFRLASAIGGGTDLGSPYNVDPAGTTRSGTWDVGAYQYVA